MKVFISWSGSRSGKAAEQLRDWLPYVFESVIPWVSRSDIEAGARWGNEVQEELASTSFGILCLTRENLAAPWILFEAGALAKAVTDSFVIPYLIDLGPSDIPAGPLTQFQAKQADRQGTWELVRSLNSALKEKAREQDKLGRIFDRWWPDLEKTLLEVSQEQTQARITRPVADMVEEILVAVRGLERSIALADPRRSTPVEQEFLHLWPFLGPLNPDLMTAREKNQMRRLLLEMSFPAHTPKDAKSEPQKAEDDEAQAPNPGPQADA